MASLKSSVVQRNIETIILYVQPFLPLANSHMVDFFSKESFEKCVPQDLRNEILEVGYEEAIDILLTNKSNFSTPKLNEYINKSKMCYLYNINEICINKTDLNKKLLDWGCKDLSSLKLDVFMTEKKSHEVEVLSKVTAAVSQIKETTHVVDIGDGKGYLSSMLALFHKIPVLGVDASLTNTDGAVKRARLLSKVWNGIARTKNQNEQPRCTNEILYKQVTQFVDEDTDIRQLINNVFLENNPRIGLVGLHTCGNLGSTSIKIFISDKNVKTICNVSCCYHLLTELYEHDPSSPVAKQSRGFPLSAFLRNSNFIIGRNARMLSSQSIDRISTRKELPSKMVFYRSVLELLLVKHNVCPTKRHVGKIKKGVSDFPEYAFKALKNIGVNVCVTSEDLNELYDNYKHYQDQLNVFYLLRCVLAPVIESLILLDRLLYLHENNCESAFLVQLFDPVISPRCYGLIAFKDN